MCEVLRGIEEAGFTEFRRKIRAAEVLSAAMQRLLSDIRFNGKVSVIIQNGKCSNQATRKDIFGTTPGLEGLGCTHN